MAVPGKKVRQQFSSTLSQGSGEDFEVFCQPCDRDDLRLPAAGYCIDCEEHLCDSCFNTHRRPKPLRHHKLLDKDNMPHTQNLSTMSSSTDAGQPDNTSPCSKHTSPPSTPALKSRTISHHKNLCVKTSSDKIDCYITRIAASFPNQVFLADYNNYSIKMVDINSEAIQQLSLDSYPWDITTTTRDELAVTMPGNHTIQLISYSSNRLSKKNTLKVDGLCYGISNCQGKFAVTFQRPAKLQIIDLKGTVLTTVITNSNGENIFSYPEYVTTNSNAIYISDYAMQAVIWLNWQGELMGSYGGMGAPQGIAMIDDGSFYVSDLRKDKCNILNVTGDCKESATILKDLNNPMAICWCDVTKTFYVSNHSDDKKEMNFIQIYKMS
ncbi:uncharacterized protein LOC123563465 [Mercenaria mercenaria]|uniref:uncharacterized protein LOC123563465 n=1 Tax=Mercenaria mercenaria TaxID=6596 RepID=UPI00234E7C57|nr:uncharacterized protein LOC123563465 [Mercenaria mercenaria]